MQKVHVNGVTTDLTENDTGGYDCVVTDDATGQSCVVSFEHGCEEADVEGEAFCSTAQAALRLMTEIAQTAMAFGSGDYEDDGAGLEQYYEELIALLKRMY